MDKAGANRHPALKAMDLLRRNGHTVMMTGMAKYYFSRVKRFNKESMQELYEEKRITRITCGEERYLADYKIAKMLGLSIEWITSLSTRKAEWDERHPIDGLGGTYSPDQVAALQGLYKYPEGILTGGPGTGKTHITAKLVNGLKAQGLIVKCAAPTGKAAENLAQRAGVEVTTIHRLLGLVPGRLPKRDRHDPINCDVVVIDEASMVDELMMYYIIDALGGAKLILVGDADQLFAIEAGQPFLEFIEHGVLDVYRLTENHRQDNEGRGIVELAQFVNGRADWQDEYSGVTFVGGPAMSAPSKALEMWKDRGWGDSSALLLSPFRDERIAGNIADLNRQLSSHYSAVDKTTLLHEKDGVYHLGDRVIFSVNDYNLGLINGVAGTIKGVKRDKFMSRTMVRIVSDIGMEWEISLKELRVRSELGYVTTIHKAQGSEADVVGVVFPKDYSKIYSRQLIYTAFTRARRKLIVFGNKYTVGDISRMEERRSTLLGAVLEHPELAEQLPADDTDTMDMSWMYEGL